MGLLEDDAEHRRSLQEAAVMNMPSQLRHLFATLMVFQTPSDIRALFDEFKEAMCEDFIRHDHLHDPETTLHDRHIHLCLWNIDTCFRVHGKSISDIDFSDLPQLPRNFIHPQNHNDQIDIVHERQLGEQMLHQLNNDQHHIHDTIINAITSDSDQNCYFVDGPAGTGKTFLYNFYGSQPSGFRNTGQMYGIFRNCQHIAHQWGNCTLHISHTYSSIA